MRKVIAVFGLLAVLLSIGSGIASAAGPASPVLVTSDPTDGAVLDSAPASVKLTFSQPLDAHYSRLEVYVCGKRVDSTNTTVTLSEISAPIKKAYRGTYKLYYFANATPKGATGETTGMLTFKVKKGPACR